MGDTSVTDKARVIQTKAEAQTHYKRLMQAFAELERHYHLPLSVQDFAAIQEDPIQLALADQVVYRFAKAQDCIGAKLLNAFMLYLREDTDRPFRDILNRLEKLRILRVDDWAELRGIRNKIAHDYAAESESARKIINDIYQHQHLLSETLDAVVVE